MTIVPIRTEGDFRKAVKLAALVLKNGGIVVLPTDTVYGIGVNIYDRKALERLFLLKRRRESKPPPVFIQDLAAAKKLAAIPKQYEPLLKKYWPGALTGIFKARKKLPKAVAPKNKVGLRVPNHKFLLSLLRKVDFPITGTSANISGQPACRSAKTFLQQLKRRKSKAWPDLVIDEGALPKRKPSTVADFSGQNLKIIRQGSLRLAKELCL